MPFRFGMGWRVGPLFLVLICFALAASGQQPNARREFRPGAVRQVSDLPVSRLRSRIERLPGQARDRAVAWLGNFHFTDLDLQSLEVDPGGGIYYTDEFTFPKPGVAKPGSTKPEPAPSASGASVPVSPFPAGLIFHSRPGSPNTLYLNFAGETVNGTVWNTSVGRSSIPAVAFSTDSDFSTYSDAEQLAIKRIWERVTEDYAPFDIDVTTERPATFDNRTAEALITRNTDANGQDNPSATAGGVAYVGVFGGSSYSNYRPAWIYYNNLANDESYTAEAASHEIGHNLGLSHDGTTSGSEYYGGHGSGYISWGPLMGTGYNRNVSQWSKGDYYLANNTQDDLATIASKVSYRPDDCGNTRATAKGLVIVGGTNIVSTTPETDPTNANPANKGVLESSSDIDFYSFTTGAGPISLTVNPWIVTGGRTRGGNLDVLLELYDANGTLLLTSNPATDTVATIQTNVVEGVYYLAVKDTGAGDPFSSTPTGYTAYASIGQYFISGTVLPSGLVIPPGASLASTDVNQPEQGSVQFAVTYSDNAAIAAATIDSSDILVTGPNGYSRLARLVGTSSSSDTTPIVATYEVDPPGAVWTEADNGAYLVSVRANEVSDIEGAWVPAGSLGQFNVDVPRVVYFAGMNSNPGWSLEPLWEYGVPNYGSGGPASGFTGGNVIAYNLSGNYENRLSMVYATTPSIDCSAVDSVTLRFRRWLRLKNSDTAAIQVSTNNTDWTDVWSTTRTVTDNSWLEIQYALPSWVAGSPNVRLRWGIASGSSQNDIGWNIDDVELFGNGSLDTVPPLASLNIANITTGGSPGHDFGVTYSDNVAVNVSTLGAGDILVTGPNGYSNLVDFVGVDATSSGTPLTATYSVPAPAGTWMDTDNGTYQVTLRAAEVGDTSGNFMDETVLGQFTVAITTSQQQLIVKPAVLQVVEGSTASVEIQLAEQPSADVTVVAAGVGGDPDLVIESGATNVFTPANWSTPVPIVFRALADPDQLNGSASFECRSDGLPTVGITVTEVDNTPDSILTVTSNNSDWGTVNPAGGSYPVGTVVQVTATPAPYFAFAGWSGDVSDAVNPLSVTMDSNITLNAGFSELVTTNHATPYWWLASFGYTNDFDNAEALTGANGLPLWQSFVAGLDPTNPDSQFRFSIDTDAGAGAVVLSWSPVTNRVYTVLQSTNLDQGFSPLPNATALPYSVSSFTNSTTGLSPELLYRLQVDLAK